MHVITRSRLQEFWRRYPDAEGLLRAWLAVMRMKRYTGPHAVRQDFAAASFTRTAIATPPLSLGLYSRALALSLQA